MTKETRVETASGGAKGDKLARFDQIPAGPMIELAYRYGLGSQKYDQKNGLDNWRNGYPFSLSMAALERHWYAFKNGEDNDSTIYMEAGLLEDGEDPLYDEEGKLRPGVSHLSAVIWHSMFLMHHLEEHPELDDRPTTVLRRTAAGIAPDEKDVKPTEMVFKRTSPDDTYLERTGQSPSPARIRQIHREDAATVTEWAFISGAKIKDYDGFQDVGRDEPINRAHFLARLGVCTIEFRRGDLPHDVQIDKTFDDAFNSIA